jgi:hypothetical protein
MKYRNIEYSIVQGIGRNVWKWTVTFEEHRAKAGQAMTKAEAVSKAELAIQQELARKKLRLLRPGEQS